MKRRSSKRKFSVFKFIWEPFSWVVDLTWEKMPILLFVSVILFSFFGIRKVLYADPNFQITSVKIYPNGVLTPTQYHQVEHECSGQNLLTADLNKIADLIKTNPFVKGVNVRRKLPNELEILLIARQPVAELQLTPTGDIYMLDQEGIVMAVSKNPRPDILDVTHFDYQRKKLDLFERYGEESFQKIPALIKLLSENSVTRSERVQRIAIDHLGNFIVYLTNGPAIRTCADGISEIQKLNAMSRLFQTSERNRIGLVDVCGKDVVVQYR